MSWSSITKCSLRCARNAKTWSAYGGTSREDRWARAAARRDARFEAVFSAIDRLILWAKRERNEFMIRLLGVPPRPPRKIPVAQAEGLPHCSEVGDNGEDDDEGKINII